MTNYMAVAFGGKQRISERKIYGLVFSYEDDETIELKRFYQKAEEDKIKIKYQGHSRKDALESISGLVNISEVSLLMGDKEWSLLRPKDLASFLP